MTATGAQLLRTNLNAALPKLISNIVATRLEDSFIFG